MPRDIDRSLVESAVDGDPMVVARLYRATPGRAFDDFAREAAVFEDRGYFVESLTWAPGEWDPALAVVAVLLSLVGIGLLICLYMLVTKPAGTLAVLYRREGR